MTVANGARPREAEVIMPSVIIASVPIHGHVTPLLGLARKLVERGDDVRFLTGARFADVVTATGARHVALPPDADFDDRDIEKRFPERGRLSPGKALAFDIEHLFAAPGGSQYAAVRELMHERSADAIVVDPTFAAGSLLAGLPSQDRPALVVVGVVPLALPGPDLAPFGMGLAPAGGPLGHLRNRILQAIADRTVLAGAQAAGRRMHERALGSPIEWPVLAWADHADAILQLSVASFEYPRPATRTELTFLGPVASSSGTQYPLPEW